MARTLKTALSWPDLTLQFLCGVDTNAVKVWKAVGINVDDGSDSDNTPIDATAAVQAALSTSGLTYPSGVTWNGIAAQVMQIASGGGITFGASQTAHQQPHLRGWSAWFIISTSAGWGNAAVMIMDDAIGGFKFGSFQSGGNKPASDIRGITLDSTVAVTTGAKMMVAITHDFTNANSDKLYRIPSGGTISTPATTEIGNGAGTAFHFGHHLGSVGKGVVGGTDSFVGQIYLVGAFNFAPTSLQWQTIADDPEGFFFTAPTLTKKYQIAAPGVADGVAQRLYIFPGTGSLGTPIISDALVTSSGGYFKYADPSAVAGTDYRAVLCGFGANKTVDGLGGPCWAIGIEEL